MRSRARSAPPRPAQVVLVGPHHPPGVAAFLLVLVEDMHLAPAADVLVTVIDQIVAEQVQRQPVAAELPRGRAKFFLRSIHAEIAEDLLAGLTGQGFEIDHRGGLGEVGNVPHALAAGDDAKARIGSGQPFEQHLQARVLERPFRQALFRLVLQGLQPVEHQQRPLSAHQIGQPLPLVEWRAFGVVGIAEPLQRLGDEYLRRRLLVACSLAVKRPLEDPFRPPVALRRHPGQPVFHQRRLADAAEGDEANDVRPLVLPGRVESRHLTLAPEQLSLRSRQPASGDFQVRFNGFAGGRCRRMRMEMKLDVFIDVAAGYIARFAADIDLVPADGDLVAADLVARDFIAGNGHGYIEFLALDDNPRHLLRPVRILPQVNQNLIPELLLGALVIGIGGKLSRRVHGGFRRGQLVPDLVPEVEKQFRPPLAEFLPDRILEGIERFLPNLHKVREGRRRVSDDVVGQLWKLREIHGPQTKPMPHPLAEKSLRAQIKPGK